MRARSIRIGASWLAAAVLLAAPVRAQVITADIEGVVTDSSGAAISGATVTARNAGTGFERVATSTARGRYSLLSLPPGPYKVTAQMSGFRSSVREGFELSLNQKVTLDFKLNVDAMTENVDVVSGAPLIDTSDGVVGKTITTGEVDAIPSLGRNYQNLVGLAPGVRSTETSNPRIGGNAYYANTWKIDGVENDQESVAGVQSRVTQDAVAEVQVLTNQFSAEFGRALGGAVNVITRSGTNDFHGRAFYYGQDGEWNAKNFFAKSLPKPTNTTKQFGATLGGPIMKDKTHFFASAERIATDNPITIRDPQGGPATQTISPLRAWGVFAKLNHQLNTKHTLLLSYLLDKNTTENANVGGIAQPDNGYFRPNRNDTVIASDVGVLSPTLVNELRVQWQKNDRVAIPNSDQGPEIVRPSSQTGRNSGGRFGQLEKKFQFTDTLTKIAGNHTVKGGLNFQWVYGSEWVFESFFTGQYVFDTDAAFDASVAATYPIRFTQGSGTPDASVNNNIMGIFAEDSWKATESLTLNLGLRYDRESGAAVETFKNFPDNNNFAPRFSFAWTPDKSRKTVVRGGFGRFYYRLNGNLGVNMIVQGAPPPDGIGTTVQTVVVFPGYPDPSGPNPRGPSGIRPSLKSGGFSDGNEVTPFADQISVGAARELGGNFAISADYVHTRGKHYARAADTNYPDPVTGLKPKPDFAQYWVYDTNGLMWYDGLLVRLDKRMSHHYQLSLAYTLSKTLDDTWPEFITQGGGPQAWYNPTNEKALSATSGLNADDDERHHVTLSGLWMLPLGFELSGVLQGNSPRRYNITTGRDNNGDGVLADRPDLVNGAYVDPGTGPGVQGNLGKNAGETEKYIALDLRLGWGISFKQVRFKLIGECYNVANRVNYSTFQGNIRSALFGQPIAARRPRTIQLGAQFDF
jgi:Carboxypeptidase regulatory-like domain/TonB dependent receptor-like, beta-barrel